MATEQSKGVSHAMNKLINLLNYLSTHPDAKLRCYASEMMLHVHSDRSHASAHEARSRAEGFFFLSNNPIQPEHSKINGAIHVLCKMLKHAMTSAAECEIASSFLNAQEKMTMQNTLIGLNRPQPPTPLQVGNTTAIVL